MAPTAGTTLRDAWRDFARRGSLRRLALALGLALIARALLGPPDWRDAVAVGAMVAIYPFGEWTIHVHLLHLPPLRVAGRTWELPTARAHREHHEAPNDLGLILLGRGELAALLALAVPLVVAAGSLLVGLVAGPVPLHAAMSAVVCAYALVAGYEWCHFLIHTHYRPRHRAFRSVWRTHRLHHFKNERYWHGITTTLPDRLLGTFPDHRTVTRSPTARTLRP